MVVPEGTGDSKIPAFHSVWSLGHFNEAEDDIKDFLDQVRWSLLQKTCMTGLDVKRLNLLAHNHAACLCPFVQGDVKRKSPIGTTDGADHSQIGIVVKEMITDDQGGPATLLFVTGLRTEFQDHDVSLLRLVGHYHSSPPCAVPVSHSSVI